MSLELITPVNDNFRRDLDVADPTLLDPTVANSLVQGEWLVRNTSGKLARVGASSVKLAYQMFTPKGDFSAQAIGKVTALQLHAYEADTDMFFDGGAGFAIGDQITVKQVTIDSVVRSAITQAGSGDYVYGVVTKDPATNGGKLRFQAQEPSHVVLP